MQLSALAGFSDISAITEP